MKKFLMITAASVALTAAPAFAQTTTTEPASPSTTQSRNPDATTPPARTLPGSGMGTTAPSGSTATDKTTGSTDRTTVTTAPTTTGDVRYYNHASGEMSAGRLIGQSVKNSANETIGDINDVVLSADGKVQAIVIGVGGFLGMGEREVAVTMDSLQMNTDANGNAVVSLNATREGLKSAPAWTRQKKS